MFAAYHRRALLCTNLSTIFTFKTLTTPFSSSSSSSSSQNHSFTINYLIQNCGFSPETASKLSNQVQFNNSQKPDSVLALFKTYGFSNSQLSSLVKTCPKILSFDPNKTILPKINFLFSKGASISDLIHIITKNPRFLYLSLENSITPSFNFIKRFLLDDESTMLTMKSCAGIIYSKYPFQNIQFLLKNGVPKPKIAFTLRHWASTVIANPPIFEKAVLEVKELGFNPKATIFIVALRAKIIRKSLWEQKINLYKKWGWSEDDVFSTFLKYPWCMLASVDKIDAVMKFFVNHMGWDSLMIAKNPLLIMLSLEKRIIPRTKVLQFLESRGLIVKDDKLVAHFKVSEALFLKKFVYCFEEEASEILKLYEENRGILR